METLYLHPETIHHYNRVMTDAKINGGIAIIPSVIALNETIGYFKSREKRNLPTPKITGGVFGYMTGKTNKSLVGKMYQHKP